MKDPIREALAERLADWGSDTYELQPGEIPAAKADMRAAAAILSALEQPAEPVAELVARELERVAADPPISGNELAQARVLMAARSIRDFGLSGGAPTPQPAGRALTDEEIATAARAAGVWPALSHSPSLFTKFARAIERAHGINSEGE